MILGIESTAHTLSFGVVEDDGSAKPSVSNRSGQKKGESIPVRQPITTLMSLEICYPK